MKMGDSNKYPYHTMDGFSEFWGQGRDFELKIWRHGETLNFKIGIPKAWGTLDTEFPQDTDKSVFLENAYFIDLISSQIKHELATLATQDTRQAWSITSYVFMFICRKNRQNVGWTSSSRGLNATQHNFTSHQSSLKFINYFVHSVQNMVFSPRMPF